MIHEVALLIFMICIIIQTISLVYTSKRPKTTKRGRLNLIFQQWVKNQLEERNDPLLSVQVLRNTLMGNSVFISALLILLGILISLSSFFDDSKIILFGIINSTVGVIQLILLVLIITFSLFNFIMSIRFIPRMTLLISMDLTKISKEELNVYQLAGNTLISIQRHWLFGVRGIFNLIPALAWIVDPFLFILGIIGITIYLVKFQDI